MKFSPFIIIAIGLIIDFSCSQRFYKEELKDTAIDSISINPIYIDTLNEEVLVIDKRFAILYFKKSDLLKYIRYNDSVYKVPVRVRSNFPRTLALLQKEKNPKLVDWWNVYTPEEREKIRWTSKYNRESADNVSEFNAFANVFIRDGKFMIIDKHSGKIIMDKLKLQSAKNYDNTNLILYKLPNGKPFWIDEDTWEHWARRY